MPESFSHCAGSLYRCRLFFGGLFIPILFHVPWSAGWRRACPIQWTAWWRWRSVVKSGGCPWYPWQRRTGQLVKFSEACPDGKGKKITIANGGYLLPPKTTASKGSVYFLIPCPCLQGNGLSAGNERLGRATEQREAHWEQWTKSKVFSVRKSVNLKRRNFLPFITVISRYSLGRTEP